MSITQFIDSSPISAISLFISLQKIPADPLILDGSRFLHQTIDNCLLTPALLPNILRLARTTLFPSNARPQPAAAVAAAGGGLAAASAPNSASNTASLQTPTSNAAATTINSTNTINPPSITTSPIPIPPPQRTPSQSEIRAIKRQCAIAVLSLLPRPLARNLFGVTDSFIQRQQQRQLATGTEETGTYTSLAEEVEESLLLDAVETDLLDLFADEYCNKHLVYGIIETVLVRLLPELAERSVQDLFEDRGIGLVSYD